MKKNTNPRNQFFSSLQIFSFITFNKKISLVLFFLFFISRSIFINPGDVFFDSQEYLTLFANPSLYHAIVDGHTPLHEGYILLFWPLFQIAKFSLLNPGYVVVLGQIFLAGLTVFCFYKSISFISDKLIGLLSSIIVSLLPLFWITNVTISLEISYLCYFFLSLYLLTLYLSKNKKHYLYVSFLFFCAAFVTYSAILLWLPVYLIFVFYKKKKEFLKIFIGISLSLIIVLLMRLIVFSAFFHSNPLQMLHNLYFSNIRQVGSISLNEILIIIRNFIPTLRNYTSLVVILGLLSLLVCSIKNKKYFLIGFLWIIPILYINQWWDSVLMGRYSILAGFGFAFLVAYILNKYRVFIPFLLLYLLLVSIPTLSLLKKDIPYIREANFVKTLPQDGLLIESHFALPQLVHCCQIKVLGVNRQDIGNDMIKKEINSYLKNNKQVFVSSGALSDPYGLYMGPYLHPLSLSYSRGFELEKILTDYVWETYHVIDEKDNLIMYRIISHGKSYYPPVMNLRDHYRRLDYYDPISRLFWMD